MFWGRHQDVHRMPAGQIVDHLAVLDHQNLTRFRKVGCVPSLLTWWWDACGSCEIRFAASHYMTLCEEFPHCRQACVRLTLTFGNQDINCNAQGTLKLPENQARLLRHKIDTGCGQTQDLPSASNHIMFIEFLEFQCEDCACSNWYWKKHWESTTCDLTNCMKILLQILPWWVEMIKSWWRATCRSAPISTTW